MGPKTFIDKVAIKTGEKQRIYESDNKDAFERVSAALDIEAGRFIIAREGPKEVPQQYLVQNGTRTQLTKNQDHTPDVTNAVMERFTIERPDGFKFRTTVTLPQGYQPGTRLPAIFWFYPWEAPNVYLSMSPFLYANNLTGALLMYHGLADQNVGTDPQNSIRLYHALNGLGKTTALYLYPLEDHGPASKETLLDLWARWSAWLDKHIKNPAKPEPKKTTTTEQAQR